MSKICNWMMLSITATLVAMSFASNPYANFAGTDSAVFNYIGKVMHEGLVPYKDVFDHKGPLLYVINWLASYVKHGLIGVWLIEIAASMATFIMIFRFLKSKSNSQIAIIVTIIYAAFYTWGNCAGNLSETYAHFFIVPVLLWILACVSEGKFFTWWQSLISGVCFASVFLLRPNMCAFVIVAVVLYFDFLMKTKQVRRFSVNSMFVLLGMAIVVVPISIYLYVNQAFLRFIDCFWRFNVDYALGGKSGHCNFMFVVYFGIVLNLIIFVIEQQRKVLWYNLLFIGLTAIILWIRPVYQHYYLVFMPGLILPMLIIAIRLQKSRCGVVIGYCMAMISVVFIAKETMQSNFDLKGLLSAIREKHSLGFQLLNQYKEGQDRYLLLDEWKDILESGESIKVLGNQCEIYLRYNARCSDYYVYEPESNSKEVRDLLENEIREARNKYVLQRNGVFDDVLKERYTTIRTCKKYVLWQNK